jgi:hypothetical protein
MANIQFKKRINERKGGKEFQSLFERHKESTSETLQASTASAESKYKFPT